MKNMFATPLLCTFVLVGCASSPDKMRGTDISPLQFQSYDCQQIAAESERKTRRISDLYQNLKSKAAGDAWQTAAGFVLWPMFLTLEGGDGADAAEYRQLKGEIDALQQASIKKKCSIDFQSPKSK
jgi:hypothetical protein